MNDEALNILHKILKELQQIKKFLAPQQVMHSYEPRMITKEDLEKIARAKPNDVIEITGEAPTNNKEEDK